MSIGQNIKRLRELNSLTQKELGDIIGVTDKAVSTWESDKKIPRMAAIQKIADYFRVQKSNIVEEDGLKNYQISAYNILPADAIPVKRFHRIPIVGTVSAGMPILADENIEGYDVADIDHPEEHFFLRVKGDSMINARIHSGDLVLVHRQNYAENGQIVVCIVNGNEATLKRFKQVKDRVILMPENPEYEPYVLSCEDFENSSAVIIGVAVEVKMKLM